MIDTFLAKFRASMPGYLDKLRSELDSGSADSVRAAAHAIKGMAANIGAEQVRQAAVTLEAAAKAGKLTELAVLQGCLLQAYEIFDRETSPDGSDCRHDLVPSAA